MTTTSTFDRITQLLDQAQVASNSNDLTKASILLKEAMNLGPSNEAVKNALIKVQSQERANSVPSLLQTYLKDGSKQTSAQLLAALDRTQLAAAQVEECWQLLSKPKVSVKDLDAITGAFLSSKAGAREWLVETWRDNGDALVTLAIARGSETLRATTSLAYDTSIWPISEAQVAAQKTIFERCIAGLQAAGETHQSLLIASMTRQLTLSPEPISPLIDATTFPHIMTCLDIRYTDGLRGQTLLMTSKVLEITKQRGEKMYATYITGNVAKQSRESLIKAFSVAAAMFPIVPVLTANLFMTEGFVEQLVPILQRNGRLVEEGIDSTILEQVALQLLSAACVDKSCRAAIEKHCIGWLQKVAQDPDNPQRGFATLVLAKLSSSTTQELSTRLSGLVIAKGTDPDQAIEGLAYTSLQPSVKEQICSQAALLKELTSALRDRPTAAFGCLTIFTNLTTYKPVQTEEQKRMAQLKAYANSSKPPPDDPLDNDAHVTIRARKLLDTDIIPALVACGKITRSSTTLTSIATILLSISREQKHRAKMTQQGAVKLLYQLTERLTSLSQSEATDQPPDSAPLLTTAHALARLLISTNPLHIFTSALPASTAVSTILPLLDPESAPTATDPSSPRDLLPTFEALLALTNLASMSSPPPPAPDPVRDVPICRMWSRIEDLLFSTHDRVRRASVEYVCNLVQSPTGAAKFADGSGDAMRRIRILCALVDVEDEGTRLAAGGALAGLSEWDGVVAGLLRVGQDGKNDDKNSRVPVLVGMCGDESEGVRHRGLVCVLNVLNVPGRELREIAVRQLKEDGGVEAIKEALRKTRDPELLGLGVEVLKQLK